MTVLVWTLVAALLPHQPLSRRAMLGAAAATIPISLPWRAAAAEQPLPLPQSAIVLQVAENTAAMQGMMVQSAKDAETLTVQQRIEAGRRPINRGEIAASIDVIIKNSKISALPNGGDAADMLRGVKIIAAVGQGELSGDEYKAMARQYERARDELKKVFDALPADQQAEGKAIVGKLQAADDARVREFEEEEERVRAVRARIAEENSKQPVAGEPRRKKTLAELEAAQAASFGKQQQQQPVVSLYAQ